MADLKPCPFCGGEAKIERRKPGGTGASGMEPYLQRAACARCEIATDWRHPKEEWGKQAKHDADLALGLTSRWNTRTAERAGGGVDEALRAAAASLRTIASNAGRIECLESLDEVRGYANSRATVAEAALSADGEGRDHG